jgi:hypothetical protein
LRKSGPFF